MRVMWLATNSSMMEQAENKTINAPLEAALMAYYGEQIQLAVAFEREHEGQVKTAQGNVCYYPLPAKILEVGNSVPYWHETKKKILNVIEDFQPDIIQCFGSEWPYGAICEETDVPIVIHMMGFLNIYHMAVDMVLPPLPLANVENFKPCWLTRGLNFVKKKICSYAVRTEKPVPNIVEMANDFELRIMKHNKYFMGRTEWDRNIVRFYAPGAKYFHVPEALREIVCQAAGTWQYHFRGKLRLLTISAADYRKGNEIILRTALVLKNVLGLDFEWCVAGSKEFFPIFEQRTQLKRQDLNIILLGKIGVRQVVKELQKADFFIHPSIVDNSPHSICEAQMIGCPVLAYNVGGVPQMIEDGRTGYLYPYNEPHTLAFLLGKLYLDKVHLCELSVEETLAAAKRHDPKRVADILFHTYERIIGDGNAKTV